MTVPWYTRWTPMHAAAPLPAPPAPFAPTEPFSLAAGLRSGHAQTIYANFARSRRAPPLARERWNTPDGDFVDVDVLAAPPAAAHVLVLHGLEGSSASSYVAEILRGCARRGFGALALNFRSCSGGPNRLPRSYHAGDSAEVAWVLERLRARVSGPIGAVGFSLGGNLLLKHLGESGGRALASAGVAISPPCDLAACCRALDAPRLLATVYRLRFLFQLRRKTRAKLRAVTATRALVDTARVRRALTLRGFDDAVTAPVHGFASAADYYARGSSAPLLGAIRRPTLLLAADDDPMVPVESLPLDEARANPWLSVVVTRGGGHVAFVAGTLRRPCFWAEQQALAFLAARL